MLVFLHLAGTSGTADIAANGGIRACQSSPSCHPSLARSSVSQQICCSAQRLINLGTAVQSLSLDFACLVVVNGNGSGETAVCWNHDLGCVCLQRGSGHVPDEISVPGCDGEGVVPLVRVGLFQSCKRWSLHAPFLLLALHVERKRGGESVRALCLLDRARRSVLVSFEPNHSGGAFKPAMVFTSVEASLIVTFFMVSSSDCKVSSSWSSLHSVV